jgi:hypothetical protein
MGEVSRREKSNSFFLCPSRKGFHLHLLTGGSTEFGMNMKISNESHRFQIPNPKSQMPNKSQIPILNDRNKFILNFEFGSLEFF